MAALAAAPEPGRPEPLGALVRDGGTNFAVVAGSATRLELLLFHAGAKAVAAQWPLDPALHRTGDVWHAFVTGVGAGWEYGFRNDGPLLLDPYARSVAGAEGWGEGERMRPRRSRIVERGAAPQPPAPRTEMAASVIYELHVRGFTRHPTGGVRHPGTYRGLVEKIPYLVDLGITAVELLPVAEFEENDNPRRDPASGRPLKNFWGYQPLAFFAAKAGYAAAADERAEFRQLVESLHEAGIEVLLDVVFNHTGEGQAGDWTVSFRGLDDDVYYLRDEAGKLLDASGCGNTLSCNHPVVCRLIVDCLRAWVLEMGVDGFRFDLAAILARGPAGEPVAEPPVLAAIAGDPVLARVKLIVEPWDAAGLDLRGWFARRGRFGEWNGSFRDDVRRFVRGERGLADRLAHRLAGSPDLYPSPHHSVNYVTCHDGFTLADLVSFERKRNRANGEAGRDGADDNLSWNCGVEGPTRDAAVRALRLRQRKNFAALLLVARGVPLVLAGDEMGRTQRGNNNAYCQDNELSWLDWGLLATNGELHRFFRELIRFRRRHPALRAAVPGERLDDAIELARPDPNAPLVALLLREEASDRVASDRVAGDRVLVAANMSDEGATLWLPSVEPETDPEVAWVRAVDTALPPPQDALAEGGATSPAGGRYAVASRSLVVFVGSSSGAVEGVVPGSGTPLVG